jgi:tol-pal system protein YbgF
MQGGIPDVFGKGYGHNILGFSTGSETLFEEKPRRRRKDMKKAEWPRAWIILGVGFLLFGCAMKEDVLILDNELRRLHSQVNVLQKDMEPLQKGMEGYKREVSKEITDLKEKNILTRADLSAETKKVQADLNLRLEALQSEVRNMSTGVEEYKDFIKKPPQEQLRELERLRETVALRMKNLEDREKVLEEKNRALEERMKVTTEWARTTEERTRATEERAKATEERAKATEERTRAIEERFKWAEASLKGTEDRFKGTEERFRGLDSKVDQVGSKQADLEKKITSREAKEPPPTPPPPSPPVPAPETKAPAPSLMGSADLYKDGLDTFYRGDMDGARKKLETFLKSYPNTELSDNAQFWIGETYYRQKDYERAILEYERVIVKYPEGDKVSAAMLKQGLSFLELGDKANARNLLRRVVERYPQSDQAELARKRLEGLK